MQNGNHIFAKATEIWHLLRYIDGHLFGKDNTDFSERKKHDKKFLHINML